MVLFMVGINLHNRAKLNTGEFQQIFSFDRQQILWMVLDFGRKSKMEEGIISMYRNPVSFTIL